MAEERPKRTIDGRYANSERIIARCHCSTHPGYLTQALMKSHNCMAKDCSFLQKVNSEYWELLEERARRRKLWRKKIRLQKKHQKMREIESEKLIRRILEANGQIYVTTIEESKHYFTVNYIYDQWVDLSFEVRLLRERLGRGIKLKACRGAPDAINQLIRKPREK